MAVPQYPYPVLGGLERQAHELAKTLQAHGVRVQAISGAIAPGHPGTETVEGIPVHRIPWPQRKLLRFFRTPFDLFTVLFRERHSYDVIHLHQFSWFGAYVIVLAKALGKPILTKLPSVGSTSLPGIARSFLGTIKLALFKLTDSVVAMSEESLAELENAGFPYARILRTPNGIRLLGNRLVSPGAGPESNVCRVVFVGRISAEKQIDDLLHAWKLVTHGAHGPVHLELWGSGPAEQEMKALAEGLGLSHCVTFSGHIESVRERLEEMDIFVLTSVREGNSNAILEAMAAGLPVVSTRVGGTPMLVGAEGAPFLVDSGDRNALSARLLELINDASLRSRTGALMRERILRHFDIEIVARTYAAAYHLLSTRRRQEICQVGNPIISADV